jgi:hypothetical protein
MTAKNTMVENLLKASRTLMAPPCEGCKQLNQELFFIREHSGGPLQMLENYTKFLENENRELRKSLEISRNLNPEPYVRNRNKKPLDQGGTI